MTDDKSARLINGINIQDGTSTSASNPQLERKKQIGRDGGGSNASIFRDGTCLK